MAAVEIKDLTYHYPGAVKPALDTININIPEGSFVLLAGASGCGKSTLSRAIAGLIPGFYGGRYRGRVYLKGEEIRQIDRRSLAKQVGIVFQDPENQLVMTAVEQEVVFGLENLGLPDSLMKRRLMEVSGALGLSGYMGKSIDSLSGGQKQKIALASVLAMQPGILVLDEPTSQLDPVAGDEILSIVKRLNDENGTTVILMEHRLDRCFHLVDRVLFMDEGFILYDGPPSGAIRWAVDNSFPFIPPVSGLFARRGCSDIPLTVKGGRGILNKLGIDVKPALKSREAGIRDDREHCLAEVNNLWFTYPQGEEALKNINLKINPGDFTVVMGETASGKSTLLKNMNGLLKPSRGRVRIAGLDTSKTAVEILASQVGYLSQNPNDYLFLPTVREEVAFSLTNLGLSPGPEVEEILQRLGVLSYMEVNPRDLSTGERQRVALACVLAARPKLLLLDEPTRGLDNRLKAELGRILRGLRDEGMAIVLVTHDVEFAAEYADHVVLMAGGSVVDAGDKYRILSGSSFYSPQVSKLFNNIVDGVLTLKEGGDILSNVNFEHYGQSGDGDGYYGN